MRKVLAPAVLPALLALYLILAGCTTLADPNIPVQRAAALAPLSPASEPLKVMIWNIGYAGLGEASDFKADGGRMLRPPGKEAVRTNLAGIQDVLRAEVPDALMMQELAGPGFLTYGIDVARGVKQALPDHTLFFSSDIRTRWIPEPFGLRVGLGTFLEAAGGETEIFRIAEEPGLIMGVIKRRYHVQVTQLDVSGHPWVLINVHLSAFDEGANTRMQQLREVLALAQGYHEQGKAVVVGGDWNMRLAPTRFSYTANDTAQFWIHDFPREELADGWQILIDPSVPSVRTNEQPYRAGVNYTTNIDGLIVSPDVRAVTVRGIDLGFRFTDHQPLVAELSRVGPD